MQPNAIFKARAITSIHHLIDHKVSTDLTPKESLKFLSLSCHKEYILLTFFTFSTVMKTHDVKQLSDFGTKTGTGIFITAPTKEQGREMADSLKKSGKIAALIQDVETLSEIKADGFLDLYADFFDLPSHYLPLLHDYFTLWEKLRVCCGVQMSKYWRNELNPSTVHKKLDPHPFCGSLDIDVVEKAFMNTTIFKMIDSLGLREINRPAMIDDALDGSYCSRYNKAVQAEGLEFNEKLS